MYTVFRLRALFLLFARFWQLPAVKSYPRCRGKLHSIHLSVGYIPKFPIRLEMSISKDVSPQQSV
jgi:hypothetical protein